jgi:sporulation protein YlmC with PRC-barrel domain
MIPQSTPILSASTLIGDSVENAEGEGLGELKELMIDCDNGTIAYAVVSFGGFLGLGDKLFAIPWQSFAVDTDRKCLRLDVDPEQLKNAPGFDKDNWPQHPDPTFIDRVYHHYQVEPYPRR